MLRFNRIATALIATGVAGMLCTFAAGASATPSAQDFVTKASVANRFEIESSRIALQRSQNPQVKQFAQQMIDDHTKVGQNLTATLQSSASGAQPTEGLDKKHQKLIDKLHSSSDAKFDKCYIGMQTKAHKEAVSLFKDYAKSGKDNALQNFAAQTLPTLQNHLDHVKQVKANLP